METEPKITKQELWARVQQYCRRQALFEQGGRVIAAVSGGADSMALLLFLLENAAEWSLAVEAVHVNHGLRGQSADADEAFVRHWCAEKKVPLTVFRLAEETLLPEKPGEDWARRERYARFEALAAQKGAQVATAHTLSDQVETLLFRLARGCGTAGAAAIPPRRGIYVRPLLCLSRQETETLCTLAGIAYRTDETNASDAYARNRLRRNALPALLSANEGALGAMGRFCEQMREVDGYLNDRGALLLEAARVRPAAGSFPGEAAADPQPAGAGTPALSPCWQTGVLAGAPGPERRAALRLLGRRAGPLEARHLALMEQVLTEGGAVELAPGLRFVSRNGLAFWAEALPRPQPAPPQPFAAGTFELPGGYFLKAEAEKDEKFEKLSCVHKKDLNYQADYDKILQAKSVLRTRAPGDTFAPAGRGLTKSLKKWFNEWKIPPEERALLPLVCSGSRVLWAWEQGFAQDFLPDENTRRVLCMHCSIRSQKGTKMNEMDQDVLKVLVTEAELRQKVAEMGSAISRDYAGKNLLMVSILKGAVVFMADLMRTITIPCSIDFMVVSSYGGKSTETSGLVKIIKDLDQDLSGRDVLIVEDILDTGVTLSHLVPMLKMRNPGSIRIAAILDKPSRRKTDVHPDYRGFVVPDEFVVGYGLDYNEKYRNLPYVGVLKPEVYSKGTGAEKV